MSSYRYLIFLFTTLATAGCLEPYPPPGGTGNVNHLVVEGFVNTKDNTATIALTRTAILSTSENPAKETGADVKLEDEQGFVGTIPESEPGVYRKTGLLLDRQKKYRLYIKTSSENKEYRSDYIQFKQAPSIDSISYITASDGLTINVNTHDREGATRYYRWKYIETWEYNSEYHSSFKFSGNDVVVRPVEESLYTCWKTENSNNIFISSTSRLTEDIVTNFPLVHIDKGSIKLSVKYSILVRQLALSEQAFFYWQNLQKTTESLGGLFDPLPSEISGNIYCVTNPEEPVIGFFSGGSIEEKRVFISHSQLPKELKIYSPVYCPIDTIALDEIPGTSRATLLVSGVFSPMGSIVAYTTSSTSCIDCRAHSGGVLTKPDFWK
jgi:hypothetical protein